MPFYHSIIDVARRHSLPIIADEIYSGCVFDQDVRYTHNCFVISIHLHWLCWMCINPFFLHICMNYFSAITSLHHVYQLSNSCDMKFSLRRHNHLLKPCYCRYSSSLLSLLSLLLRYFLLTNFILHPSPPISSSLPPSPLPPFHPSIKLSHF
jgi:hypothetical protein